MNRRDLLKRLGIGLPAVALAPFVAAVSAKSDPSSVVSGDIFHGWRMYWTGWKDMPNSDILAAQWMAYSPDIRGCHLYSSCPGGCGPYVMGNIFDLSFRKDQTIPRRDTKTEDLAWMRNESLERLKRIIVKVGPPPIEWAGIHERLGSEFK